VCEAYEVGFGEGAAEEGYADGQTVDIARGNLHVRIASDGRGRRASAGEVVAVDEVGRPSRAARRSDERVEAILRHHCVNALRLREKLARTQSLQIGEVCERAFGFGAREKLLAEVWHLAFAILFV